MDDLQRLLNEFGDLVKKDLLELANNHDGTLNIRIEELGMIFVSNALAYAVNMGTSKEELNKVVNKCMNILDEEQKPKIIC